MNMLDDIDGAVADGSRLYGMMEDKKIPYLNGDVEGNKELLIAGDKLEAMSNCSIVSDEIQGVLYEFAKRLGDKLEIPEDTMYEVARGIDMGDYQEWSLPSIEVSKILGNFSKCLFQKLNPEMTDQECFEFATKDNIAEAFKIWSQS